MRHSMKPDLRADYKIRLYTRPKPRSSRCPAFEDPALDETDEAEDRPAV